jgi:cell division protein FtsX
MEDFLEEETPKSIKKHSRHSPGYGRLFVFITALMLLGQLLSFLQIQINRYNQQLTADFKVILTVLSPLGTEELNDLGKEMKALPEVKQVKFFSTQDGLKALQAKNPRLTQAVVTLGREMMPTYFELRLYHTGIGNIRSFIQRLSAQYPQLSAKYVAEQADMILYTDLCLRVLHLSAALVFVLLLVFMFLVEASPLSGGFNGLRSSAVGVLGALVALGLFAAITWPMGLLTDDLSSFTTWNRQIFAVLLGGLLGRILGKWQRF